MSCPTYGQFSKPTDARFDRIRDYVTEYAPFIASYIPSVTFDFVFTTPLIPPDRYRVIIIQQVVSNLNCVAIPGALDPVKAANFARQNYGKTT